MHLPQRKSLDHHTPSWIKGAPIYFVTICTCPRGTNQLCHSDKAQAIFGATEHYQSQTRWHAQLMILMPDHLHALLSFPKIESLPLVIRAWKHYLSKQHGIIWQRDYFDHRLRNDESHDEKASYIKMNPVRAGLVSSPEKWPYTNVP